jgi:arylformamidase
MNEINETHNWIDVSVPLREGMVVWPKDIKIKIDHRRGSQNVESGTNSSLFMGVHTGTHMDAPRHFFAKGKSIDEMPFDTTIGPARVIEIADAVSIKENEIRQHNIRKGERILFKTRNSQRCWQDDNFVRDFVYLTREAARYLANTGVRLVGIDYLSVGSPLDPDTTSPDTHQLLLGAEIWLIEGLNLSPVNTGNYNLVCLPLKLIQTDGSPVRVILEPVFN